MFDLGYRKLSEDKVMKNFLVFVFLVLQIVVFLPYEVRAHEGCIGKQGVNGEPPGTNIGGCEWKLNANNNLWDCQDQANSEDGQTCSGSDGYCDCFSNSSTNQLDCGCVKSQINP